MKLFSCITSCIASSLQRSSALVRFLFGKQTSIRSTTARCSTVTRRVRKSDPRRVRPESVTLLRHVISYRDDIWAKSPLHEYKQPTTLIDSNLSLLCLNTFYFFLANGKSAIKRYASRYWTRVFRTSERGWQEKDCTCI